MVGMELVVGYLFAWAVGKAKRVAGRVAPRRRAWEGRRRDPERVSRWLGFLARHLEQRGKPDLAWWEPGTSMRLVTRMTVTGLVSGACIGLLIGPMDGSSPRTPRAGSAPCSA
ncbi:hypothetical protein ACIQOW_09290 [Kitasatospora sp. NPDC091335]|uniref:hypothetical protein n=1 Tax=Kitasatospora sp. NPDC091335 TaxID=3364085 RepID=UPI0038071BF7